MQNLNNYERKVCIFIVKNNSHIVSFNDVT